LLTVLSAGLGFFSSFAPKILGYFEQKQSNAHELAMLEKQAQLAEQTAKYQLEQAHVESMSNEMVALYSSKAHEKNDGWVGTYRAMVRPTIAFAFLGAYLGIKGVCLWNAITNGVVAADALPLIWNDQVDSPILSAIIAFYFGSRMFQKR
tara:strand:+ start:832 stop:1281 length:450 start_codon:yes stop_codon:yes gene_type:complete